MQQRKSRAKSIIKAKVVLFSGVIVEMKVWEVPKDNHYPEGFKYSLYAVYGGRVLVGYDNHKPKGHHRHIGEQELAYHFTTLEALRNDFRADLEIELGKGNLDES